MLEIRTIRAEGLGDSSYLLAVDGVGLVVDPQRDIDRYLPIVDELGVEVRWVFDTHLHNDYVSGARHLARALDAELVLPAGAAPAFRHRPAFHREALVDGDLSITPLHTPGHTPEHTSFLVTHETDALVFTGGSLLVGSAGRSDLLGSERAPMLARLQHGSPRHLASLPDATGVYPSHGAGSFCSASAAGRDTSTIGIEKRTNSSLQIEDEDDFVRSHLDGLPPFPSYYAYMGAINTSGGTPIDLDTPIPRLDPGTLEEIEGAVTIVDSRAKERFARGHLKGSIGVELRRDFAVWVGWLVPIDQDLVLVVEDRDSLSEARRQLGRIGYDRIVGYVDDVSDWSEDALDSYPILDVEDFSQRLAEGAQMLDTRAPDEWESGHVSGSVHAYVPDVAKGLPESIDRDEPVLVACGTGYRATISASLLQRAGYRPEVLVDAGVGDLSERSTVG